MGVDEWVTPTLSHNLELRMHLGIRHGLDLIQFVTYLSQNHVRLLEPHFEFYLDKKQSGSFNLAGALIYAASLLEESGEAQETIKRMRLLSKNIKNNYSVENIQEVISFLINCKANQILGNPDLYLHKD